MTLIRVSLAPGQPVIVSYVHSVPNLKMTSLSVGEDGGGRT